MLLLLIHQRALVLSVWIKTLIDFFMLVHSWQRELFRTGKCCWHGFGLLCLEVCCFSLVAQMQFPSEWMGWCCCEPEVGTHHQVSKKWNPTGWPHCQAGFCRSREQSHNLSHLNKPQEWIYSLKYSRLFHFQLKENRNNLVSSFSLQGLPLGSVFWESFSSGGV